MNRRRAAGIGAAVVLAGLGSVGVISWANSTKTSAEAQEAQTSVVIVDTHVPKGADANTIKADTHVGTVAQKNFAPGALTSEDQIGNQVALADLEPGDQLVSARLGTSASDLPAGTVEMSIKLDAERAVGGVIQSGSLVDIYISPDKSEATMSSTLNTPATPLAPTLAFQKVRVTNVQTAATTTDEKGAVKAAQYIVTLALTANQQALVAGAEYGHIWLVLEPSA
jgi:pilus assembly protein CpaB